MRNSYASIVHNMTNVVCGSEDPQRFDMRNMARKLVLIIAVLLVLSTTPNKLKLEPLSEPGAPSKVNSLTYLLIIRT